MKRKDGSTGILSVGDVDAVSTISLTFSQPMIELSSVTEIANNPSEILCLLLFACTSVLLSSTLFSSLLLPPLFSSPFLSLLLTCPLFCIPFLLLIWG